MNRSSLLKRVAVGSAALSIPSLAAVEAALAAPEAATATVFPKHPKWKFAFINHVTTNPFFVPTQYGAADAAKLIDDDVHVDGLDEGRRRRDDQRVQRGDQRQGRRHRRLRRRQGGLRGADKTGAQQRASRSSPTTRTGHGRARRPARPTSGRTCTCRASRWASGSSSSCRAATSPCSSQRPARSTSSPASTARSPRSSSRASR